MTKNKKLYMSLAGLIVVLIFWGLGITLFQFESKDAFEMVLTHSNTLEQDVIAFNINEDERMFSSEYDIEFETNEVIFYYEVSGSTKSITSYYYESKDVDLPTEEDIVKPEVLTLEDAKGIALEDANLEVSSVIFFKTEQDEFIFHIEFYTESKQFDYEIDAQEGTIISRDFEIEDYTPTIAPTLAVDLTIEDAKRIALDHAIVTEASATFVEIGSELEDGEVVYNIEFFANDQAYDYVISGVDGTILSYDYEINSEVAPGYAQNDYITLEEAKMIALTHANLTEELVTDLSIMSDVQTGELTYVIEFNVELNQYKYEIEATSGTILNSSY